MIRHLKYFLATSCLLALGIMIYRFSRIKLNVLPSKVKIYSFSVGENSAVAVRQDGELVGNVHWNKGQTTPRIKIPEDVVNKLPNNRDVTDTVGKPRQPTAEEPDKAELSKTAKSYKTTIMVQPKKATVAVMLPPLTKAATTVRVVLQETSKTDVAVATVKPGDVGKCSHEGEQLVGALAVDQHVPETEDNIDDTWSEKGWVEKGGAWRPTKCEAVSKVAIVIPYRKREQQLKIFLRHMHPMLKRQLLDYRIMVIEQDGETPFNRAMLFNIGYKEALKFHDFKCFIFHDVDLIPENDKNYYGCPSAPRHLSVAVDKFNYRLPYQAIFGGAGAFRKEDFEKINGFSNSFWGWGGEDDDLYKRITAKGFKLTRPSMNIGRYKMVRIFHKSAKADPKRFEKLRNSRQRMSSDGLNSLKYKVLQTVENPLYTKVTVEVYPDEVRKVETP